MTDWNAIITEALIEVRADTVFTRGAILHGKVSQIARRSGLDFEEYLKQTRRKLVESRQVVY